MPLLRPAAFFCAVVPPCEDDDPDPEVLPPRLDAPGELAITVDAAAEPSSSASSCHCPADPPTRKATMDTIEISQDPKAYDDADARQREKLSHRLEAVSKALDELRAEIDLITTEIEEGP